MNIQTKSLFKQLINKGILKQKVYANTVESFQLFKQEVLKLAEAYVSNSTENKVVFEFRDRGEFEFEVKFAGDILVFLMHTNVFEIPRQYALMRTSYIKQDKNRTYCGIINIYNFLADSFKYARENDLGYLIGRIFINHEKHFLIEGKKEIGMIYNNFEQSILNTESAHEIVTSAIEYTINFDLLIPPFETVKMVSVFDIQKHTQSLSMRTAKRLGYKFQADEKKIEGHHKD
ncbi:MAG: hypothetical protein J7J72_01555 [Bacteroidales bacterium]|nr:hypothetical protein [Bacteroidales bacterium]